MQRILVSGATGLVGSAVVERLNSQKDCIVYAGSRRASEKIPQGVELSIMPDLGPKADWRNLLNGLEVIIHCAARVHIMNDSAADPLEAYRIVNVAGTLNLASQAAQLGVRRFVFVSSIKVNGEVTLPQKPFTADDVPTPLDPYGLSKFEAEQGLREIEAQTGMEVVIVRPPLVYGPMVKANFASMMRCVAQSIPLPLGAIHNARSLVALDNLVDLLVTCANHPAAAGQTFLVSDGEDVSTTELLRRTARAMGKKAFLLPVPAFVIEWGGALLGKRAVAQRLCSFLQVDIEKNRRLLAWTPPLTLDEGLKKAVEGIRP